MKRTEKAATKTGRGRKPRESSATTQGRAGAQAPQVAQTQAEAPVSTPAPGGLLPEDDASEPNLHAEVLREAGIAPEEVRSVRFDERRRVLTVKTRDFAVRELVVPRSS